MRHSRSMRAAKRGVAAIALGTLAVTTPGCAEKFDTARPTQGRGSLGREMYTVICDRVGAQALREDITGASYHDVCHADASGDFASRTVDLAKLPELDPSARDVKGEPVTLEQQERNRKHRIARIEALARRRDDLIAAFDLAFANEPIGTKDLASSDPKKSCEPSKTGDADLRTELADMLGRMSDLYNDETVPHFTRALSRVMAEVEKSPEAQAALARFDARQGYRPRETAMGIARPALSYPHMVDLANALLRLVSADTDPLGLAAKAGAPSSRTASERTPGKAHAALVGLLATMREELRTAQESPAPEALVASKDPRDDSLVRLSRPRKNLELAREVLLHQDEAFSNGSASRWVLRRDPRGVAKVVTLPDGRLPTPFLDLTGPTGKPDGLPDIDDLGRFITQGGDAPSPFASDRREPAYEYFNVSNTFLSSLVKNLVPMLEPDPKQEHETLMDLFGGLLVLAGARDDDANTEQWYGDVKIKYRGYRGDASPLLDLVHAASQLLATPHSDETLALLYELAKEKPQVLARLVGVGFKIKAIADAHPEATLPASSTLWDEMLDVLVAIAQKEKPGEPGKQKLVEDIIRAFGNDAVVDLKHSAIAFMTMRDELTYDRKNLNGPTFNLTTGKVETFRTPVDRSKPDTGDNRSAFQKFLQVLHDTNGMSVCTKEGAVAHVVWKGIPVDFPSFFTNTCVLLGASAPKNPSPMCGLLRFKNVAEELINAAVGKINLDIRDDCLRKLVDSPLTGIVGGADAFLEEISGIKGFNTKPSVPGIDRLIYFDLPFNSGPGDTSNPKTLNFLKDTFEEPATLLCPQVPFTDSDGAKLNLRRCAPGSKDSLHARDPNALFPLEQLGFLEAARPLAQAFYDNGANLLFVDLFDTLHRHWGSVAQSRDECDPDAPKTNARWCSRDGAVTYEPLIAEALDTDLFPAMHDAVKELETIKVAHCDARDARGSCTKTTEWDGVKVLAEAVMDLVDPAKNKGLKRRNGDASVVRNDGTKNAQVTPIYLLIDALKSFDDRLADHKKWKPTDDRLPAWRRARSQVTDQLFAVDGTGKSSQLTNPAVEKILPTVISTLRSQLAAHCPDPTNSCEWARTELTAKLTDIVRGPIFAGVMDVADAIRADEPARTELERFLVFLLQSGDAAPSTLTALADILQILDDDGNVTALLRAAADTAGPEELTDDGRVKSRGLLLAGIEVMSRVLGEARDGDGDRICSKEIDPNRTLAVVLRKLVTPPPDGKPAPIEVLIDVAADVNRLRPEETTKLRGEDYGSIAREVADFCSDPSSGLEQVYTVIKQATMGL